ncbi:MAG: DUF4258 domain-containing protein [Hormoscilla sp. GM7CHS1pb]|nr:DUF4258 domain-containing protein [Hormoscilla sp. GM7CHS1pb]
MTEILNDSSNPTPASKPVGRKEAPLKVVSETNTSQIIAGREYSGHALDRMQRRGLTPSVVENTIESGTSMSGKVTGTTAYHDSINNVTVIINTNSGRVVTVSYGKIRQ